MGQKIVDMIIVNNQSDHLCVSIKDAGKEIVLSRGEVAFVFATGVGSNQPTFTLVTAADSIEVSASDAEGYLLAKETPKSKPRGTQTDGLWDRELDARP